MARKRDDRSTKSSNQKRKERKSASSSANEDENLKSFKNQLAVMNLMIREIPGDGNCLFRALGDQLEGHGRDHAKHRQDIVEFMRSNRSDFEPFVEDDVTFDRHVENLSKLGTYAGNDAIVAFARLHKITVVIHQLNAPLWQISGVDVLDNKNNVKELHIAYHNGDHYSSMRKLGDYSELPADIRLENKAEIATSQQKPQHKNGIVENDLPIQNDYCSDVITNDNIYCDLVMEIMEKTGCQDIDLIKETLESQMFDINDTVDWILNLVEPQEAPNDSVPNLSSEATMTVSSSGIWSTNGTGTRLFGSSASAGENLQNDVKGARPKLNAENTKSQAKRLTNRQRKELKRQERKRNNEERKRNKLKTDDDSDTVDDVKPIIVKGLERLKI